MGIAKIIYPIITIGDQPYFGKFYFLCPRDCIVGRFCEPQKIYKKLEVDRPENVYELVQDNMKREVKDEFKRHKEAMTGSSIRCPSGDYTFKITKDLTEINGTELGEPFNECQEILMRECDII
jgi:hypothetical protein